MKCTQWRSWQAQQHFCLCTARPFFSARLVRERVWSQQHMVSSLSCMAGYRISAASSARRQMNHLKGTCSVGDKEFFTPCCRNNKRCQKGRESDSFGQIAHKIQRQMVLFCFLMTTEENTKPGSSVWMLTGPFHPWDWVDFFFWHHTRRFSALSKPESIYHMWKKANYADLIWKKRG